MIAEGDLANSMDQSNKIREMQDKISHLRAQVGTQFQQCNGDGVLSFVSAVALILTGISFCVSV